MRVNDIPEIARLTAAEKILFVEELWDSIASEQSNVPVPSSHREELDRRLMNYEKDPGRLLTLGDLQERIEANQSLTPCASNRRSRRTYDLAVFGMMASRRDWETNSCECSMLRVRSWPVIHVFTRLFIGISTDVYYGGFHMQSTSRSRRTV